MPTDSLLPLPEHFEYRPELAQHVTPRLLKDQPVHRWFYFPHSYSPQLVEMLLDEWQIQPGSVVVDPFVGAGTTMRAAQMKGISCIGADLSPLSVLVSNVKVERYEPACVEATLTSVRQLFEAEKTCDTARNERLQRAFRDAEFARLLRLRQAILQQPDCIRDLFLVGLLRTQQAISRAVPDGGWFRWVEREASEDKIWPGFEAQIDQILADVRCSETPRPGCWRAYQRDARNIADISDEQLALNQGCHAIITSPPYPNRHDYSRVFQIELLTLGMNENDIFDLRHNSLRSHVEARPPAESEGLDVLPSTLEETLRSLPEKTDRRIEPMLRGYFEDMDAVLRSSYELLLPGGMIALVVGNVRHVGVMVPVDEILMQVGEAIGYTPQTSWVARLRGNSAQQMGRFGRVPARESVVILQKS